MDTTGFRLNHTMLRVRDPNSSLEFYKRYLGATLIESFEFDDLGFTLYFLGFQDQLSDQLPSDRGERIQWMASQSGLLELTHNHGTEKDPDFEGYHSGNSEPKGFGHICISVPDIDATCDHLEQAGVEFIKKPNGGSMKGIAFIKDPDGYWIELFSPLSLRALITDR